jgi:hypothetical protein
VLSRAEGSLRFAIEQRLKQLLGIKFEVAAFYYQAGDYRQISNLWPSTHPENSVSLFVEIGAPEELLIQIESLEAEVSPAVEDVAGLIVALFRDRMPGARSGANIYDVEIRWDPTLSGLSREAARPVSSALALSANAKISLENDVKKESEIFISYSHRDVKWLTSVQTYLQSLKLYNNIDYWDDTRIKPGSQWRTDIRDAIIQRAEVFILLISANFLASDFIAKNELHPLLKAAKQEGKLVVPVILNHAFLDAVPELAEFRSLNPPSKPLEGMSRVGQGKLLTELAKTIYTHLRQQ